MISDRLKSVIIRELDLDDWDIDETTTASTVPGWDSLSHIRIICAVEQEFGLRLSTVDVLRLANVGNLQALVNRKQS